MNVLCTYYTGDLIGDTYFLSLLNQMPNGCIDAWSWEGRSYHTNLCEDFLALKLAWRSITASQLL